jgi:hypothetical protein
MQFILVDRKRVGADTSHKTETMKRFTQDTLKGYTLQKRTAKCL